MLEKIICPRCKYRENSKASARCEVCDFDLKSFNLQWASRSLNFAIFWAILLFFSLALPSLIYNASREKKDKVADENFSLLAKENQQSKQELSNENLSHELKVYNSMQEVSVPEGMFSYGGAIPFASLRSQVVLNAITRSHPQFRLRYVDPMTGSSSRKGIVMLLDGQLSFSQSDRPVLAAEYHAATDRGFQVQQVPVAIDTIAFFTNPSLGITGLSAEQIQKIYTGKIKNWKQVGGPDLAIVPVTINPEDSSVLKLLTEGLSGGVKNIKARVARDYTQSIRVASANLGAISYGSASVVRGQKSIRPVAVSRGNSKNYLNPFTSQGFVNKKVILDSSYPLTFPVFVVIRRDDTDAELAGVAYANLLRSKEGQALVEKMGFLSLF